MSPLRDSVVKPYDPSVGVLSCLHCHVTWDGGCPFGSTGFYSFATGQPFVTSPSCPFCSCPWSCAATVLNELIDFAASAETCKTCPSYARCLTLEMERPPDAWHLRYKDINGKTSEEISSIKKALGLK
jgi:hypothetical protein